MVKAYIVASINVVDAEKYQAYLTAAIDVTRSVGGRLLVSGGRTEPIEGRFHERIVVIEFESVEAARRAAAGYSEIRAMRGSSAPGYDSVIVEGVQSGLGGAASPPIHPCSEGHGPSRGSRSGG